MIVAVGACSKNPASQAPPTIAPASAAASPPVTTPVDGDVRPLTEPAQSSVFDGASKSLVVLLGTPDAASTIATIPAAGRTRTTTLPGAASAMAADGKGGVYLAKRGGYFRLDVARGTVEDVDVAGRADTQFSAITLRADGRVVLGSSDGGVYTIGADHTVNAELKIFAHVDALVARGNTVFVLDRAQTSVTTVAPGGTQAQHALRAGAGATNMALDSAGRVLVTDTRGEQLLVFGSDPLILRQQFPVRGAPYGVVGSSGLAWVSQTATNTVVGYDLATGIPVEKVRYRTVQQPNSLAFDDETGTLYVVSGSGAGVQVIAGAGRRP